MANEWDCRDEHVGEGPVVLVAVLVGTDSDRSYLVCADCDDAAQADGTMTYQTGPDALTDFGEETFTRQPLVVL